MVVYILKNINEIEPRYVGITTGNLQNRLTKHLHDIKREKCKNLHKKNWLKKNKEFIIIEKIDEANSIDELKEMEKFYIKKYKDQGINLLNLTDGGDGTYGYKHNLETIEKISGVNNINYGKKHSDEWKLKMKGRIPWNKGIKMNKPAWNKDIPCPESVKEKLRQINIGRKDTEETKLKKKIAAIKNKELRERKVECLIDEKWISFNSLKEASLFLNVDYKKISLVCQGKRNHTGGYKFRYKNIIIK